MRLAGFHIENFKSIGAGGCLIRIDEIVVLIGRNNAGKSTILDAYEALASSGAALDVEFFHGQDPSVPIVITGFFDQVSPDDEERIGKGWRFAHDEFGDCVAFRYVWSVPLEKARKQSFDPDTGEFGDGGLGGFDSLIMSRIPQPVRIRPTDPVDATQAKLLAMLKDHVKQSLKADSGQTQAAFDQIEQLAQEIFTTAKQSFDELSERISRHVGQVFPGTRIALIPRSKDALDEKLIAADSYLQVTHGNTSPLGLQGTGLQRALLWSTLSVMSGASGTKKKPQTGESPRILLIDEPEAFLHPPTIRGARESLYAFALDNPDWQVIATTHSPIFIDLSKDHTTIIRVDSAPGERAHVISTDRVSFDAVERERLQMIRACNPVVNEFFFYDDIVLVEGATEQVALLHVARQLGREVHVINCLGKANLPLFARILNHFQVPYAVVHDADTPFVKTRTGYRRNAMWTMNTSIRDTATASGLGRVYTQFPHFEGEYFDEAIKSGKVDRVLRALAETDSADHRQVVAAFEAILRGDPERETSTREAFDRRVAAHVARLALQDDPLWSSARHDALAQDAVTGRGAAPARD